MLLDARVRLALIALALGAGCTGEPGDTAEAVDPLCEELTWDSWGNAYFATYCNACHSASTPNRFGATEGVNFDTLAETRTWAERIRVRVLEEETMPLGGGVKEDDLYLLDHYLSCGL